MAIPYFPLSPGLPHELPPGLNGRGLLLKQNGEETGIATYRLQFGDAVSGMALTKLCLLVGLKPKATAGEKSVGGKSRLNLD